VPDGLAARVASFGTMFAALDIVEVAHETGLGLESVAAIHFALGVRLELHWLRDRVEALSRDDRWAARARAALRDDLYTLHRTITAEVLRSGAPDAEPDERVQAWIDANPGSERYLATLADVRGGRVYDLTTLPVVLREVRNLVQAPGAA
jgi:glutamate dehydrogenase